MRSRRWAGRRCRKACSTGPRPTTSATRPRPACCCRSREATGRSFSDSEPARQALASPAMDLSVAGILLLDGVTNGAVYALLALALVLVFAVTRVIFIPQGEFVAYGALTLAMLQLGKVPGTVWLLAALAVVATALDAVDAVRRGVPVARIARRMVVDL